MKNTIELNGMRFFAYHGCLEREREEGNLFLVDFWAELPDMKAAESDKLSDTLNVNEVYYLTDEQMSKPSDLIENVAWRIFDSIASAHPEIPHMKVKVSKQNPPVAGQAAWSCSTVEK